MKFEPINVHEIDKLAYLPDYLSINYSNIKNAGLGIFAKENIKAGTFLGNYTGELSDTSIKNNFYVFNTVVNGKQQYINAENINKSNWTRFMNSALTPNEENVVPMQCNNTDIYQVVDKTNGTQRTISLNGKIVFFAKVDIPKESELLYSYGNKFNDILSTPN